MNGSFANFALAVPIDASKDCPSPCTFEPATTGTVATWPGSPVATFFANFEGLGNTISHLTINQPSGSNPVGLFGQLGDGDGDGLVENIGLIGASIVAGAASPYVGVGGLVGINNGGAVASSYATGTISAQSRTPAQSALEVGSAGWSGTTVAQ